MRKMHCSRRLALICLGLILALGAACSPSGTWTGTVINEYEINAPVQKVFAYLENAKNQLEWSEGLKEIECKGKGVGTTCTWKSEAFGQEYQGFAVLTEYVPNQKTSATVMSNDGDIAWYGTTLYLPTPKGGTRVVGIANFTSFKLPSMLSSLPHETVQKKIEELVQGDAQRIKAILEK